MISVKQVRFNGGKDTYQFMGQVLKFTPEVQALAIDYLSFSMVGAMAARSGDVAGDVTDPSGQVDLAIGRIVARQETDSPLEVYEYMVTPNEGLAGTRPIEALAHGDLRNVLKQIDSDFH